VGIGIFEAAFLDGFGMTIGRAAAPTGTVKGARYLEGGAGTTRGARLVAFDLANAARVTRLAQAIGFGRRRGLLLLRLRLRLRLLCLLLLLLLLQGRQWAWVTQGVIGVGCMHCQHVSHSLEFGERGPIEWLRLRRRRRVCGELLGMLSVLPVLPVLRVRRVESAIWVWCVRVWRCWICVLRHGDDDGWLAYRAPQPTLSRGGGESVDARRARWVR
jgi:hypothetical protein